MLVSKSLISELRVCAYDSWIVHMWVTDGAVDQCWWLRDYWTNMLAFEANLDSLNKPYSGGQTNPLLPNMQTYHQLPNDEG